MYFSSIPPCCVHHMPSLPSFGQPNNILRRLQIVDISDKAKESLNEVISCEVT